MQFPEIPTGLSKPVENSLKELRKQYGRLMVRIRFSPQHADELLAKAADIVEQAERILNPKLL